MTLLSAAGKPISAQRQTTLELVITDRQAGAASAERSVLGFALDSNTPQDVANLLQNINQSVIRRLYDIGFMAPPVVGPGGIDPEEGKGSE